MFGCGRRHGPLAASHSTSEFQPSNDTGIDARSDTAPRMVVTSDGRTVRTLQVSLGQAATPTYRGTKIVEELEREQNMGGTEVPWSVRLTNSGEFVHAAPRNSKIGQANLSHGCTNHPLTMAQARRPAMPDG